MNRNAFFCFPVTFLLFVLGTVFPASAQSIQYDYDAAGNRTARIYHPVQLPLQRSAVSKLDTVVVSTPVGSFSVTVYPNPTKGDLSVSVRGLKESETATLRLFDSGGLLLYQAKASKGNTPINMSRMKSSWYVLQVSNSKEVLHFKIIRE